MIKQLIVIYDHRRNVYTWHGISRQVCASHQVRPNDIHPTILAFTPKILLIFNEVEWMPVSLLHLHPLDCCCIWAISFPWWAILSKGQDLPSDVWFDSGQKGENDSGAHLVDLNYTQLSSDMRLALEKLKMFKLNDLQLHEYLEEIFFITLIEKTGLLWNLSPIKKEENIM